MLLPLSAFEATTALPAAAVQLTRSRIAARRLLDLAPPDRLAEAAATPAGPANTGRLAADVWFGHVQAQAARAVVDLSPGTRLAVTGPSGSGKTTLLMTLAGLLPPLHGRVLLDEIDLSRFDEAGLRRAVTFFAEDAHVFATTVRDNLLVVRGDCSDDELTAALAKVGLGGWLAGLPEGLSTMLIGGAQGLSAGQRRRLLLARAVLSPARIVLLDEPTEHLDATDAEAVLRDLLVPGPDRFWATGRLWWPPTTCPTILTVLDSASAHRRDPSGSPRRRGMNSRESSTSSSGTIWVNETSA
ncbi:ABC transporter family protein [Mycobacterium kansasii]|uniref:ABC transporter family protein n=1 Tax=Mycobacterium kansasii TaxID=1768 RepID=A0A1V3WIE6_MYCKA|nr:ABC transporter family protein [Mycobacterium kansasii]